MSVAVIVATHGDERWADLAVEWAVPSTVGQHATEVIVYHDERATLAQVRNTAAAGAVSDWLCFLDADDRLGDGYLAAMRAEAARNHGTVAEGHLWPSGASYPLTLLVPSVQYVGADGRCHGDPEIPSWGRPLIDVNCAVIGTLVPRGLFEAVGGFREWPLYEDYELWCRCAVTGAKLVPVRPAVYCAHTAAGGGRNLPDRATQIRVYGEIRALYEDVAALHVSPDDR